MKENYSFTIYRSCDNNWYLADCYIDDEMVGVTQGKTKEEIFMMVADLYLAVLEIPVSKWSRFWHKLLKIN